MFRCRDIRCRTCVTRPGAGGVDRAEVAARTLTVCGARSSWSARLDGRVYRTSGRQSCPATNLPASGLAVVYRRLARPVSLPRWEPLTEKGRLKVMRTQIAPILLASVLSLAACTSAGKPSGVDEPKVRESSAAASRGPMDDFPVGSSAPFEVYAHCGVEFTTIDGMLWRTTRRDDGQGNPPKGWPQSIRGTLTRPAVDRAVFEPADIPANLIFEPAPEAEYYCD